MPVSLSQFALEIILDLVKNAVEKVVDITVLEYFEQRKVRRRVEDAVADVVEPLLPFLHQEKISEEKQYRLIRTCVEELRPFSDNPSLLFEGSLNGQVIFDELYSNRPLPDIVIEDGVKEIYALLFPRVAELLCKVPAAIKEWETLAWQENYRRLDELVSELRKLFNQVDELQRKPENQADEVMGRVRRQIIQKIGFEMDITGLRGDQPYKGKISEFFVHPSIEEICESKEPHVIATTIGALKQFIRPYQKNIVIGAAGAGKSTWAKWLQREILNSNNGFAVRIELRSFSQGTLPSIYELIREAAGKHLAEELTVDVIFRWIKNHLLVIIFDGFDEVNSIERDKVYEWMVELNSLTHGCPIILTSRPLTTDHLDRTDLFTIRWVIQPFDSQRIIEYIQHWYNFAPLLPEAERFIDAQTLAEDWRNDPTLAPLTGNPLLLSTLLMVHHLDGRLPSGRSRLYQRYIDGMLGLWDQRRKLMNSDIELSLEQKKHIIRGLALFMFIHGKDELDEDVILDWLNGFLIKLGISYTGKEVLSVLRERSGLIIGPGVYNFAHKSIAEYLVAEIVWEGDQYDLEGRRIDRMYLFENRESDQWNSVLFFWVGLASVGDIVTFIELCQEVENWTLAYGILYDQYERIADREIRRHLLLPNLKSPSERKLFRNSSSRVVFGFGCPSDKYDDFCGVINTIKIDSPALRGFINNVRYSQLISLSLSKGDLCFEDGHLAQPEELMYLLWLHSPELLGDGSKLTEYLHSNSPGIVPEKVWSALTISRTLHKNIESIELIKATIGLIQKEVPNDSNLIPLFLMSQFYMMATFFSNKKIEGTSFTKIKNFLRIMSECGHEEINKSWLLGTKNWRFDYFIEGEHDLLEKFKQSAEGLVEDGILPRDDVFLRALSFADYLIEQRNRCI